MAIFKVCSFVFHFVVFAISVLCYASNESTKIISTRAGTFKGIVRELDVFGETRKVEKYLGIPYAESPKRFRKSIIKATMSSSSVYDATRFKPSCSQLDLTLGGTRKPGQSIETSEDCLFLNIFKPLQRDTSKSLTVMVWFHGGGFVVGSPQIFAGDTLSAYGDVIVIGVNYRLALWGFMSTGDKILPGNLGLWDQHIALKWVHQNIRDFGGDPNNVAIFGMSAGSASVVYQSLFPENRGFFTRAIGSSGSITCPWSFQPKPLDITVRFASLVGCDIGTTTEDIVNCIESKSTEEVHGALDKKENGYIKFPMEIVSVIDNEFLTAHPYKVVHPSSELSTDAKEFFASLDFMTGITAEEGAMNIGAFVGVFDSENFALTRQQFEKETVPEVAKLMYGEDVPDIVYDMIIHKYTNWSNPDSIESIRQSFLKMTGDYVFNFHAKLAADMHANLSSINGDSGRTFVYYVEALPSQHIMETPAWVTRPNHADDGTFLFGYDKEGYISWTEPYSDDYEPAAWELEMSKLYMTLYTNFAKTGYG